MEAPSPPKKSILMPCTPMAFSRANSLARSAFVSSALRGVCSASFQAPAELYQASRPMFLALAWSASSFIFASPMLRSQLASTSV